MNTYHAWVAEQEGDAVHLTMTERKGVQLPEGDVTIRVAYSSVNYKDGLALRANSRVVQKYPVVPGIDLAGTVTDSQDPRYKEGDPVIVTGYDLGVSHDGGYSELARVPADWIVPLPAGLTLREAMIFGTAGFTAALSIHRLEQFGLAPDHGPVLVTGATGGVGSLATAMLAARGYEITASTGKSDQHFWLHKLGATNIIDRSELIPEQIRPLGRQTWAAAVDSVGGRALAFILSSIKYGGAVAVSGLTGGTDVPATVYPFILRGVNLLGIDSVYCPMEERRRVWARMASDLKPEAALLDQICTVISFDDLPPILSGILRSEHVGRYIVRIHNV